MALFCAISNEVPEHPVVSPSGNVFERSLIVKYIEDNGVDPLNGEALSVDQLIPLKVNPLVKPRPPSATSIPAILKLLQDEWDACMLHTFTLRQQLQTSRQELSHALYQHDAACRVIARLTKEVTAAREALATLKPHAAASYVPPQQPVERPVEAMEVEHPPPGELPEEVAKKLQDVAAMLTAERKRRGKRAPEGLTSSEQISDFQQLASHPGLHSASIPGILALDLSADSARAVTGGADKNAVVFHKDSEQIIATLKGHTKKVTSVIYHPREDVAITASPDATIRMWTISTSASKQIIKAHDGPVSGISLHATGDYILSASADQYWAFSDFRTGRVISKATSSATFTCTQFHPDGLIFGTGSTDSIVKIWDLKERTNVANFPGHSGKITSIAFSENGYYLATSADDSTVKLWDLRKLKNFRTINLEEGYEVNTITFDQSGTYLAVGGSDVRVYLCKQWTLLKTLTDHSGVVTGVKFGQNASFLASVGMDRSLKYYGIRD
ncbi:pre-mRNA-processing factor 19-like [Dysidea avara]|uniref:pre-mRNA-processing factor 19-like n=1 Tax=Dysidea avara TaxID=196820 RepID=UPI00332B8D5B